MASSNTYIGFIDGFRGYAISFVILSHLGIFPMDVAYFGVTLFFFVSGLLITKLMLFEQERNGFVSLKDFYLRRVFRLYPALLLMLFVSCLIIVLNNYKIIWADLLSGLFYFTNYFLVYFEPVGIDAKYLLVSRILWSLSVEEHFYLLFPIIFIKLYSNNNRVLLHTLVILLIVFLLTRIFTVFYYSDSAKIFKVTYYTTHCRADSILFGCISALLIYRYNLKPYLWVLKKQVMVYCAVLGIVISITLNDVFFQYTFKYTLQGVALMVLIPAFAFMPGTSFLMKLVNNKAMIFVGRLSYSLYLFHWVALKISNLYIPSRNLNWYCLMLSLTILMSLGSYYLIEKPFVRFRIKYGSNAEREEPVLKTAVLSK